MHKLFLRVFLATALCLFVCSPVRAAEVAGDDCPSLGTSTISADRTNIIACMLKTASFGSSPTCENAGGCVWKSMTGGGGGVPVGVVVVWPSYANPPDMANWLECNGQAITKAAYPELYAVVGGNVPDYRGMFLRGLGSQTHVKNNGAKVGNTATVHSSGALGLVQGDAVRNYEAGFGYNVGGLYFWGDAFVPGSWQGNAVNGGPGGGYTAGKLDISQAVPTANENRPVNVAVRYFIRAKP